MVLQHQRVLVSAHGGRQRLLLGLVKDDAVEIMIADAFEQLTALLHHRHHLDI